MTRLVKINGEWLQPELVARVWGTGDRFTTIRMTDGGLVNTKLPLDEVARILNSVLAPEEVFPGDPE